VEEAAGLLAHAHAPGLYAPGGSNPPLGTAAEADGAYL
jgi:hypothetical protein